MVSANLWAAALLGAASALAQAGPANAQGSPKTPRMAESDCNMTMVDPEDRQALYPPGTTVSTMVNSSKAKTDGEHVFHIPAPAPLGPALGFFLCTSGGEVTSPSAALRRPTAGVRGSLSSRQALERLLTGTGLSIAEETPKGFVLK